MAADNVNLAPWKPGEPITADRLNAFQESTIEYVAGGPGVLAIRSGRGVGISLSPTDGQSIRATAIVQGSPVQDGSNYRWAYKLKLARKKGKGFDGEWEAYGPEIPGFNRFEWLNTDTPPAGLSGLDPIEADLPVEVELIVMNDGTLEAWFEAPNDGDCDEEA